MTNWRNLLHSKRAKYIVLALAVADGAGYYLVQNRLNQPWTVPAGAETESPIAMDNAMPVIRRDELISPPSFAINDLPAIKAPATIIDTPVPALVPEVLAVAKELPTNMPGVHLSSRKVISGAASTARLERSRRTNRSQFSNVFAAEAAYPAGRDVVGPAVEFGPGRTNAAELPQYGAASGAVDVYAPAAALEAPAAPVDVYAEVPTSVNEAVAAPEAASPVQELPASEPASDSAPG